ncbi:DUF2752 domain-containing protein [Pontimicrobium sp. SW4]|uniref:DUF2752 domain-containing protein n=1 Tax=Pontimicrobium sp. SW4 TaxID=3153519 RepID=A0AAU7BY31_9FLAO
MLPCLSKKLLGIECFGCGFQRSLVLLFQGDFIAAFKMYPGIYPLFLLGIFILLNFFFKIKNSEKIKITLVVLSIVFIVANYILKITN